MTDAGGLFPRHCESVWSNFYMFSNTVCLLALSSLVCNSMLV